MFSSFHVGLITIQSLLINFPYVVCYGDMLLFLIKQYVTNLGMDTKYQFHDVFGLDPDLLAMLPQPCIALLLLFPINEKVRISC